MADHSIGFASDFDAATDDAWRALVDRALGGRDFVKSMTAETYNGFPIEGLYTRDSARVSARPVMAGGDWGVTTPHWNPDVKATNQAILEDLSRGATGLALRLEAGRFPGIKATQLAGALDGVFLNMAHFNLVPGEEYQEASAAMLALLADRGHAGSDVSGALGVDPLGTLAQTGRLKETAEDALKRAVTIAQHVQAEGWGLETFMADSGAYHMAGATEAQELGLMLATGVAYLRAMVDAGMGVEAAAEQIAFSMAADADVSLTLAKFRAARLLWAAILKECGISAPKPMRLNAASSLRMMSVNDPWVNVLRATAACFAAGVGGADNICVLPHDSMLGMSSAFARRIARNVQIILQEESGLSRVVDPAGGSFAFESITSDISDKAWEYFRKIESKGGMLKALRGGDIQTDLKAAWDMRRANIAKRKDPITGVSEFPDIEEKSIGNVGAMPPEPTNLPPAGDTVNAVAFHRLAEDFEKLRAFSDSCLAEKGQRPSVYVANIGKAGDFTARATFAKNFFEAGGIKAVTGMGGTNMAAIADDFKASGARLAVIASSDELYGDYAQDAAALLKKAGAHVYLAGRPLNAEDMAAAGVEGYVYMGCDVLEVLAQAHVTAGEKS